MSPIALLLTALGLSTDAFAAAIARGGAQPRAGLSRALRVGAVFGGSEALMCLAGWVLASQFARLVAMLDHWIALILLSIIGGKMLWEGLKAEPEEQDAGAARASTRRAGFGTFVTALGTSIDAAAVGVALAFVAVDIGATVAAIGLTSFAVSSTGYFFAARLGEKLGKHAETLGGLVLIAIGLSIFVSHVTAG